MMVRFYIENTITNYFKNCGKAKEKLGDETTVN
jgi:hypothetical protein